MKLLLQVIGGMELEDGLAVGGFVLAVGGLAAWLGPAVAATVGGTVLFVLGLGLAIYKDKGAG